MEYLQLWSLDPPNHVQHDLKIDVLLGPIVQSYAPNFTYSFTSV